MEMPNAEGSVMRMKWPVGRDIGGRLCGRPQEGNVGASKCVKRKQSLHI